MLAPLNKTSPTTTKFIPGKNYAGRSEFWAYHSMGQRECSCRLRESLVRRLYDHWLCHLCGCWRIHCCDLPRQRQQVKKREQEIRQQTHLETSCRRSQTTLIVVCWFVGCLRRCFVWSKFEVWWRTPWTSSTRIRLL